MKVLVIGSGGREHAQAVALARSESVSHVFVLPGNGGTESDAKIENVSVPLGSKADGFRSVAEFAREKDIALVLVGPEQPLVDGIVDCLRRAGVAAFGPSEAAAQIEASKAFSKRLMADLDIPTARFEVFSDADKALAHVKTVDYRVVVKASGLAAGKGVLLPETIAEAEAAVRLIMCDKAFGAAAGTEVVIEERLEGPEISVLAVSDGYTVFMFPPAQDHKRIGDGDTGLNTGGMGAYCPVPFVGDATQTEIRTRIVQPTIDGMRRRGTPFVGLLFVGIMLTREGPKVLEYNCRFGDPETQVVLPLLRSDFGELLVAAVEGRLDSITIEVETHKSAVAVVAVSQGYPGAYAKGKRVAVGAMGDDASVYHAGTRRGGSEGDAVETSGGRVLAVCAVRESLGEARAAAYSALEHVQFEGMTYRRDIGAQGVTTATTSVPQEGLTYASAGVSIDAGNELVRLIGPLARGTRRLGCDAELGGFGGLFDLKAVGYADPVLVSGTDGVGTKLLVAQECGLHATVGIDLVAMSVNDILAVGAEPLFFLDYFATGHLEVEVARDVVAGVAAGCVESGCALLGGETAEMPSMYAPGHYDIAGFAVGAVERTQMLPRVVSIGDTLIGVRSSGLHSNGFSLVRRVVALSSLTFASPPPFPSPERTLGAALLTPTRLYIRPVLPLIRQGLIQAVAHITGGGFSENVPRVLDKARHTAHIDAAAWTLPPLFKWLQATGNIAPQELQRTFNCGIGLVLVVTPDNVDQVLDGLGRDEAMVIGSIGERTEGLRATEITNLDSWIS